MLTFTLPFAEQTVEYRCKDGMKLADGTSSVVYLLACQDENTFATPAWPTCVTSRQSELLKASWMRHLKFRSSPANICPALPATDPTGSGNTSAVLDRNGTFLGPCLGDDFRGAVDSTCSSIRVKLLRMNEPVTDLSGITKYRGTYKIFITAPTVQTGISAKIMFSVPVTLVTVRPNSYQTRTALNAKFYPLAIGVHK